MGALNVKVGADWVPIGLSGAAVLPTPAWIAPTLLNGWTIYSPGSGFSLPGYRKIGDIVYLRGMITGGSVAAAPFFNLPVGYRISGGAYFIIASAGTPTANYIQVNTSGDVRNVSTLPSNSWLSLDGVYFSVTA